MICKICGSNSFGTLYQGQIRLGKFGDWSAEKQTVYRCEGCQVGFLGQNGFCYEEDEYRQRVDDAATIEGFYRLHDREQAGKFGVLGTEALRDKVVADIGCGGGSWLDFLAGVARETIAIEPARAFRETLAKKHRYFRNGAEALTLYAGKVDLAFSFAVIEHVEDPLGFVKEVGQLLKPGGSLWLSTPNYDDWLIGFLPGVYDRFFFRRAHTWYFNGAALTTLAEKAGFSKVSLKYVHRFDLANALHWIRDHQPTGLGRTPWFQGLDDAFQRHLESLGKTDFLYARLWA
jgi:2-polyprenyl-3-methyl-5-hydroxy-6-metoxy-1,4-benzoquinol methylase